MTSNPWENSTFLDDKAHPQISQVPSETRASEKLQSKRRARSFFSWCCSYSATISSALQSFPNHWHRNLGLQHLPFSEIAPALHYGSLYWVRSPSAAACHIGGAVAVLQYVPESIERGPGGKSQPYKCRNPRKPWTGQRIGVWISVSIPEDEHASSIHD